MRTRKPLAIGAFIAVGLLGLVAVEVLSTAFILYRVRTEIELTVVSGEGGTPIPGARIVPIWAHSQEPVSGIAPEITDKDGFGIFHLDLSFCRGEGLISSLWPSDRPHLAYVPYDFRVEHPQFQTRLISIRDDDASWLQPQQVPSGLDAKLAFNKVELQPLGSQ